MTVSDQPRSRRIGASIAVVLAARALADRGPVTLVERDVLPHRPSPRRGVPRTGQMNGLRRCGCPIIEMLLPPARQLPGHDRRRGRHGPTCSSA